MKDTASELLTFVTLAAVLAMTGCAGELTPSTGDYVVERTSADGVETVRTVSGSRWGANATLVENLAIGEEIGDDAYLLGSVNRAWATDDRVYLIDAQIPAVRAFDSRGRHLYDVGRPGQGPGEYGMPTDLAVTTDGRIIVADAMGSRLNIYGADAELVEDWPLGSPKSGLSLVLSYDDEVYAQAWSLDDERLGMQAIGPEGPTSELVFPPAIEHEPQTVSVGKGLGMIVPFSPGYTWAFAPGGEMIAGVGDAYRFEIRTADGRVVAVERAEEPTSVSADEANFVADWASSSLRQMNPDLSISSADVPTHKPAFSTFYPDRAGRVWVTRQQPGRPDPGCIETEFAAPPQLLAFTEIGTYYAIRGKSARWTPDGFDAECWTDTFVFDVFDVRTGDFLGTIAPPEVGFRALLFADDETVLAAVMDEAGTVRLKRYRLQIN